MSFPQVSVIIPCRNEEKTIQLVLSALAHQTYPIDRMEIVIADGFSTDNTRQSIQIFITEHPELAIHLVDNPRQIIPAGLNTAIRASRGEIVIRMDAHSIPREDYVERCVDALNEEKGDNVGGVWDIQPRNSSWIARSIAAAASNPLAVGDAQYRYTDKAACVDTVPYGAFRRELIDRIGFFDESLLANEDYEFNARIRKFGGKIWLDPLIRCTYYARATLKALAKQYFGYGFWKTRMLKRYPETLRWRQALPPIFVAGMVLLPLGALAYRSLFWVWLTAAAFYIGALLVSGLLTTLKKKDILILVGLPLAVATMHFSWGSGFLAGLFSRGKTIK